MAQTYTFITPEMGWANLANTYAFLKNTDATTADEKIISYLDQEVQKAVNAGLADEATIKARLRTNLVADKKSRFKGDLAKLHLVSLFDEYTKHAGADVRQQYKPTASTVKLSKSKWQYTVEELKQLEGDEAFWRSIYNNIASVQAKRPEAFDQYFGTNGYMIAMDAKDYARQMAANCRNKLTPIPTTPVQLTLEEKIQKGIPVVITPDIVKELIKLYPNVTAEPTEYTEADADAYKAKLEAEAEAKAKAAAEEAKAKAEATPKPEAEKNYDISPDMWAKEVDKENTKPEIIIPDPTPEAIIWERASKLRDEFARKQTDTIYVWDLETEFDKDIDEALEEITKQYPDNFLYDAESGEINFCPDEN